MHSAKDKPAISKLHFKLLSDPFLKYKVKDSPFGFKMGRLSDDNYPRPVLHEIIEVCHLIKAAQNRLPIELS